MFLKHTFIFVSKAFRILRTLAKPVITQGQLVVSQAVQNWIQFLHEPLDLLQILSFEGTSVVSSLCSVNTRNRRNQIQTHTHTRLSFINMKLNPALSLYCYLKLLLCLNIQYQFFLNFYVTYCGFLVGPDS